MAARELVTVRLSTAGRAWCEKVAQAADAPFSVVVRAALTVAAKHEAEVVRIVQDQQ